MENYGIGFDRGGRMGEGVEFVDVVQGGCWLLGVVLHDMIR